MKKKVYIVHGWGGSPNEPMHQWVTKKLQEKHFEVLFIKLPRPEEPMIDAWVGAIENQVTNLNEHTYFIGHSIGCQTILRYLSNIGGDVQIGGCILIAPWITLDMDTMEAEGEEAMELVEPWLKDDIDWRGARIHTNNFTCIFSNNDPYVPLENIETFKNNLQAKTITEENKGHYTTDDNVKENKTVIQEILRIEKEMKRPRQESNLPDPKVPD